MYYFDNNYLAQYFGLSQDVKVYVNGEYLSLTGPEDVAHPQAGVGYTEGGEPVRFTYPDITQVKVGNSILTIDMLQHEVEKIKNPETPDPKETDDEGDGESSPVDNKFSTSGGGGGGDFGDGGDFDDGEDFEGGDETGGGEADFDMEGGEDMEDVEDVEGDEEPMDDEPADDQEEPETTADSIIRSGNLIEVSGVADSGNISRYGVAVIVNEGLVTYTYYDHKVGKTVMDHAPIQNVKRG